MRKILNAIGILIFSSTSSYAFSDLYPRDSDPEMHCLALNIYHESRSDNLAGQYAVSDVVLNRVESKKYPDTICGVVKQAKLSSWWKEEHGKDVPVKNKCQFSWYCDGKSDEPEDKQSWHQSQYVAYNVLQNRKYRGISEGATHYHATYVSPKWAKSFYQVGRIGKHIFYRMD